jgi:hypothetical protein
LGFGVLLIKNKRTIIMNIITIITAVLVIGIIWGGEIYFISRAMKFEKRKAEDGKK